MANQRINEVGKLIGELRAIDEKLKQLNSANRAGVNLKIDNLVSGQFTISRDLSQMMLAMATNYLAERRANIIERLENEYKLRDTA